MSTTRTALVAGSFDPITNGHLDVVERARRLFDRVVVAVLVNPGKTPLLTIEERLAVVRESVAGVPDVDVVAFEGLLVEAARAAGACAVVRGLRSVSDFEHEWPMARMNAALLPGLETVCLPAAPEWGHVSSTLVRQIHALGGDITPFVPPAVVTGLARVAARREDRD